MKALPQETVETLKGLRQSQNEIQSVLGDLYVQAKSIEKRQNELLENLANVNGTMKMALEKIREDFGDGSIDLDKGEFIPGAGM